jgi:hypothetical protein
MTDVAQSSGCIRYSPPSTVEPERILGALDGQLAAIVGEEDRRTLLRLAFVHWASRYEPNLRRYSDLIRILRGISARRAALGIE